MTTFKVLAIDDDQEILEAYRRALSTPDSSGAAAIRQVLKIAAPTNNDISFEVTTASQGEEGYNYFREAANTDNAFSVAFIDMRMPPGWDGLKTAEAIRAIDPDTFIIFVSAHTDRLVDELRVTLGPNIMMLRKPISRQDIYQCAYAMSKYRENLRELQRLQRIEAELQEFISASETSTEVTARLKQILDGV